MIKLLIVDDEPIICQTIHEIINWTSLGIEVIGHCYNGLDAYNIILDSYPDIVLTDINMPILSGIDLIKKVRESDKNIEFIILSGYGDFEYAKSAITYGVKAYLLKPCNENQIVDAVLKVVDEIKKREGSLSKENALNCLEKSLVENFIFEHYTNQSNEKRNLGYYEHIINFSEYEYCLFSIANFDKINLDNFLDNHIFTENAIHILFSKNMLLIFFRKGTKIDGKLAEYLTSEEYKSFSYSKKDFRSLEEVLEEILLKTNNNERVLIINNKNNISVLNHSVLITKIDDLLKDLPTGTKDDFDTCISLIKKTFDMIENINTLKFFATNILIKLTTQKYKFTILPKELLEHLDTIDKSENRGDILDLLCKEIYIFWIGNQNKADDEFSESIKKLIEYVEVNLDKENISLKWIAENVLFMNVDYLSKQFVKQTGTKFSTYLNSIRMEKAKKMLLEVDNQKIYLVAQAVGCGDNPQYFSQLFKKYTGISPTNYLKTVKN